MNYFWEVIIKNPDGEYDDISALLIEHGANACLQSDQGLVACFNYEKYNQEKLESFLKDYDCEITKQEERNWVLENAQSFQPVQIGEINIIPVIDTSEQEPDTSNPNNIYLIPGMGFGSGHHETTRMMIEYMQSPLFIDGSPRNILDFGTGSGILSIITSKLIPKCDIMALDNDPQALINAQDNLELNNVTNVELSSKQLDQVAQDFDMILANIFLSVLIENQSFMADRLRDNGVAILSGITSNQYDQLIENYQDWEVLQKMEINKWIGVMLRKST